MGCGVSKLEPGEGPASGLRSIRHDMWRWRNDGSRARKDSIVSTTGVLHPEELDDGAPPAADGMATMTTPPHGEVKCLRQEQGGEEQQQQIKKRRPGAGGEEEDVEAGEKRKGGGEGVKRAPCSRGPALADSRRARSGNDDEDLPGSPSFRVYFVDSARESSDDESVSSPVSNPPAGKIKGKKCRPIREDSMKSITSEESEGKLSKGHKPRRLIKGLTKGPAGAVYGLLSVRSCYSIPNTDSHQESGLPPSSHTSGRISNPAAPSANHSFVSEKVA